MNTSKQTEALKLALEALEEIALAGMSPAPEMIDSKEAFHARQAWRFIGIAARSLPAIREALAEQPAQQEPVAYIQPYDLEVLKTYSGQCQAVLYRKPAKTRIAIYTSPQPAQHPCDAPCGDIKCAVMCKQHEQPAQQQEPVAWRWENGGEDKWLNKYIYLDNGGPDCPEDCEPLYTSPPASKPWVGLSYEEIDDLSCEMVKGNKSVNWLARAIEAKLREKNA